MLIIVLGIGNFSMLWLSKTLWGREREKKKKEKRKEEERGKKRKGRIISLTLTSHLHIVFINTKTCTMLFFQYVKQTVSSNWLVGTEFKE